MTMVEEPREDKFSSLIGFVLRYGVITSFAIVTLGCILLFVEGQTGYYTLTSAQQLVDTQNRFLIGPVALLQGVASLKPFAVIDLGLLVLLATPVARVVVSIPLFAAEKRYIFVAITATVLVILLLSIFVVAPFVDG
jgi:uncharacterized membrane protein